MHALRSQSSWIWDVYPGQERETGLKALALNPVLIECERGESNPHVLNGH